MFIFAPSGLGCDLEFGFGSFEFENPLICIIKMFDRAAIVRPLGRCRIAAGEVNRDCKGAARRAAPAYTRSVYVHQAAEPSSSPALRRTHVSTTNQVACVQFDVATVRAQQRAARKNLPHFFPGRWQSLYSSLIIYSRQSLSGPRSVKTYLYKEYFSLNRM